MKKGLPRIQQVSIKGFLCRDNKVLLLKTPKSDKNDGTWELPGGRMDFGESVEEAFSREMKEELGFEKAVMGKLLNSWSFMSVREGIDHHFIIFDFEIYSDESKIKLSDEHDEYRWIGEGEFEKLNMREGHKETLRKYFGNTKN
ncbi:MAG: NUDIX domain-containing protein [Candidatus Paceibacterota bacterium]|jgi:8-oxo-dGTP pyrophosphatase MutT (NUDIX family)